MGLSKEETYQIGGDAMEYINKVKPNLSQAKKEELYSMIKEFTILQFQKISIKRAEETEMYKSAWKGQD